MPRQMKGWGGARGPIAASVAALAVAGLVWDVAAGSGLAGAGAAPATVAPAPSPTPAVHSSTSPAASSPAPTPSTRLAATTSPTQETGSPTPKPPAKAAKPPPAKKKKKKKGKGAHKPSSTKTTLLASPSPATAGGKVTLTATEKAAGGGHPAGDVQFEVGGADLGTPVAVNAAGVATTTTAFAAAGKESLSAEFTPTSASFIGSKGIFSLVVRPVPANIAGVVTISVVVPRTGAFTVTVQPGPVQLTPSGSTATGKLPEVTVTDTRNYRPGWSLSGQASRFTYSHTGKSVSGNQLGWVPTVVGSLHDGARLGRKVASGRPGLGSAAATLAFAPSGCGSGRDVFSANLTLNIPRADDDDGRYTGTVTITYVESSPSPTDDDQATCGTAAKGGDR